jgi:hypothetical protein
VPDERLEGAGGLRLGWEGLVADGARGELDPVPGQNVRGDEVGERLQRAKTQLGLRPGSGHRPGNSVRGARVSFGEPGHASPATIHLAARATDQLDGLPESLPSAPLCCSFALGLRWSVE